MSLSISAVHRHALALLQEENYGEAMNAFRQCWNEIRTMFQIVESTSPSSRSVNSMSECNGVLVMIETDDSIVSPHNIFGLFGAAFALPAAITTHHDLLLASHFVLFNQGLTYHISGLCNGRSTYLYKAMAKYQLVLQILSQQSKEIRAACALLELATIINLGHLHAHFCDVDQARLCRDVIRGSLFTFSPGHLVLQQPSLLLLSCDIPMQHWAPAA
jgi:hypothetical protein